MPVSTATNFRIVIVGAGIAGLASAIALRAPGREIIILEASRMNKEVGAAISLQPNATRIAKSWGIVDELIAGGGAVDTQFQVFRTDGQLQMRVPFKTSDYDADRLCFHRVDLHETLKRLATDPSRKGEPASIRVASKAISCDCTEGIVRLENGDTVRADLVIAADGIHSKLRSSVLGEEQVATPTGLSAYRLIIPKEKLLDIPHVSSMMTDKDPGTTMLMGRDCRVIMGPCRQQQLLSIVALVPDKLMHEQASTSWTAQGSLDDLLQSFEDFPHWIKDTFRASPDISLWQLRDMDTLPFWTKGRTILIGDAAHSMLPTQGQGASQSIEDAEALGAFFADLNNGPASLEEVEQRLKSVFDTRYERASLIQKYSRQQARPATEVGSNVITMNPVEFMDYNCRYSGAKEWAARAKAALEV